MAVEVTIYHNPRCSKSRQTLDLIRQKGIEPRVIEYLTAPPAPEELRHILTSAGLSARQVVRAKEAREEGIDVSALDEPQLVTALCQHPRALERPLVVAGDRAVLGRPPEAVLAIL